MPRNWKQRFEILSTATIASTDISSIIRSLSAEGYVIQPRTLATLSPYLNGHLKRYGDYIVDFDNLPQPLETAMVIPIEPETQ